MLQWLLFLYSYRCFIVIDLHIIKVSTSQDIPYVLMVQPNFVNQ